MVAGCRLLPAGRGLAGGVGATAVAAAAAAAAAAAWAALAAVEALSAGVPGTEPPTVTAACCCCWPGPRMDMDASTAHLAASSLASSWTTRRRKVGSSSVRTCSNDWEATR